MTVQIASGHGVKLRKHRTTSLTGMYAFLSYSSPRLLCIPTSLSLGERYGLRIIPGANSFLVLPNNISRSTAVGAILHPGGPAHSPRSSIPDLDVPVNGSVGRETGFVFAVGGDEKLLRRLNELDNAETVSTSGKGTDAKWKLDAGDVGEVMWTFANCP
jgi:trehalose 6-phosphate synthase complex regulatory subunit